jgi:hypothetical protein
LFTTEFDRRLGEHTEAFLSLLEKRIEDLPEILDEDAVRESVLESREFDRRLEDLVVNNLDSMVEKAVDDLDFDEFVKEKDLDEVIVEKITEQLEGQDILKETVTSVTESAMSQMRLDRREYEARCKSLESQVDELRLQVLETTTLFNTVPLKHRLRWLFTGAFTKEAK